MNKVFAVGTRYWNSNNDSPEKIVTFVEKALAISEKVFIAINITEDMSSSLTVLQKMNSYRVIAIPVQPWGFTFAMNALIKEALNHKVTDLLSQSVEIELGNTVVNSLLNQMNPDTLCVGARLPGHIFKKGEHVANGRTIPWNTCKILKLQYYQVFGFPIIGDMLWDPSLAGIEEITADSIAQHFLSGPSSQKLKVKMMEVDGINWHTDFNNDPKRLRKHEEKMSSKIERAKLQLKLSNIPPAKVFHL